MGIYSLKTSDKLLTAPGPMKEAYTVFAVTEDDSANTVLFASKNWHGPQSSKLSDEPFEGRGFVVFRKGGDGAVLLANQINKTNLIGEGGSHGFFATEVIPSSMKSRLRSGMTTVELIVAIAIVLVIFAFLITPQFDRPVRYPLHEALSNLRQLQMAMAQKSWIAGLPECPLRGHATEQLQLPISNGKDPRRRIPAC